MFVLVGEESICPGLVFAGNRHGGFISYCLAHSRPDERGSRMVRYRVTI